MKTLVQYDHLRKQVIIQYIPDNEEPELHLRDEDPDPYWHTVDGKWEVVDTRPSS